MTVSTKFGGISVDETFTGSNNQEVNTTEELKERSSWSTVRTEITEEASYGANQPYTGKATSEHSTESGSVIDSEYSETGDGWKVEKSQRDDNSSNAATTTTWNFNTNDSSKDVEVTSDSKQERAGKARIWIEDEGEYETDNYRDALIKSKTPTGSTTTDIGGYWGRYYTSNTNEPFINLNNRTEETTDGDGSVKDDSKGGPTNPGVIELATAARNASDDDFAAIYNAVPIEMLESLGDLVTPSDHEAIRDRLADLRASRGGLTDSFTSGPTYWGAFGAEFSYQVGNLAADETPYLGQAKGLAEAWTGLDARGEEIGAFGRVLAAINSIPGGGVAKRVIEGSVAAGKGVGRLLKGTKKLDEVAEFAGTAVAKRAPKKVAVSKAKHPESSKHIEDAQAAGHPKELTIARENAKKNRTESLKGLDKVPGKHLDEYPPAFTKEGGRGASVRPISPSDNMGAGARIGNLTRGLPDGAKIIIEVVD